jgi:predicted transcriptional regulator
MSYSGPAVTLSVRISPEMRNQLDELSDATGRTKSFLATEAIESYLLTQAWQVNAIKKAVKKANAKGTRFIDHHKVVAWVNSWDKKDEQEMPK